MNNQKSTELRLQTYMPLIEAALNETGQAVEQLEEMHQHVETPSGRVFDTRSKLYELAMQLCGYEARKGDLVAMRELIQPQTGEIAVDLSAGTGFLTKAVNEWTGATTFGVDPSHVQLSYLRQNCQEQQIAPVYAWPDNAEKLFDEGGIPQGGVDFVTSFGGIHHINKHRYPLAFENVAAMLKAGGRFAAADVCCGTSLSRHFDDVVSNKCLTGHDMGLWMNPERLVAFCDGLPLELMKTELKPLTWDFNSLSEMAWFFKGLHAYPQSEEEVACDLRDTLGYREENGKIKLNWPMLFWEIRKK